RQGRCERRKTMLETYEVSDARGIVGAAMVVIRVAPLREAFPANPGITEPERCPDILDLAPETIADHCCAPSPIRRRSARAARRSSSLTSFSPSRPFGSE